MVANAELSKVLANVDEDSLEYRNIFESQLIYLGTFGLEDPVRENLKDDINNIQFGETNPDFTGESKPNQLLTVKMVSGDHVETCRKIAFDAGIINEEEYRNSGDVVMTGEQFRERIGPFQIYTDEVTGMESIEFENEKAFKRLNKKIRVIARATQIDKFILIRGIQQESGMIGMAGDSIADSVALKTANVGFCMGTGCDVAKDNSDLIIIDNDFKDIILAIRWGRAMFENSRKFIVFQFTVSFAVMTTCFISGVFLGNIPFNVLQLLWINLVMDILAAIALGTGRETNKMERVSRKFKVFEPEMWRQIIVQGSFQILIMLIFVFFGGIIFNKPYHLVTTDPRNEGKVFVDTFIFHTFFMLTMFN